MYILRVLSKFWIKSRPIVHIVHLVKHDFQIVLSFRNAEQTILKLFPALVVK